jgi:hypothetical protein
MAPPMGQIGRTITESYKLMQDGATQLLILLLFRQDVFSLAMRLLIENAL